MGAEVPRVENQTPGTFQVGSENVNENEEAPRQFRHIIIRDHGVQQAAADGPQETEAPALCSGSSHGVSGLDGVLLLGAGGRVFTPWAAATTAPEVDRAVDSSPGRAPLCGPDKQRQ